PATSPLRRHTGDLAAQVGVDIVDGKRSHRVAGFPQPRDRLPHLADRPSVERELRGPDDRLVAEVHGVEAETAIERNELRTRTERRDPPPCRACDPPELVEQILDLVGLADRVAADERAAVDDAVREERPSGRREQEPLVAAQREVRETVAPLVAD